MRIEIPDFESKDELFAWLRKNHDSLIAKKKAFDVTAEVYKAAGLGVIRHISPAVVVDETMDEDTIAVKVVMNTTLVMDGHSDVHDNGLWNKSLKENDQFYHLQEHTQKFSHVLSDNSKAYVQSMRWKDLGLEADGETEALVFESRISKAENPKMFDSYKKGKVRNHSVGMRYVKMLFAMNSNDPQDSQYKENFDNYIGKIVNRDAAEKQGYFWVVKEAKLIEGSAVVFGSNSVTPTLQITTRKAEPVEATPKQEPDLTDIIKDIKTIKFK